MTGRCAPPHGGTGSTSHRDREGPTCSSASHRIRRRTVDAGVALPLKEGRPDEGAPEAHQGTEALTILTARDRLENLRLEVDVARRIARQIKGKTGGRAPHNVLRPWSNERPTKVVGLLVVSRCCVPHYRGINHEIISVKAFGQNFGRDVFTRVAAACLAPHNSCPLIIV